MKRTVIDITIIVWIVTLFLLLMVGDCEISLNPLHIRFGRPWQMIGLILISVGIMMIYHQGKLDSENKNNEDTEISIKD